MQFSKSEFLEFVASQRFAAVLFTAPWAERCNESARSIFDTAAKEFGDKAGFVELDVDQCVDIAREIPILNVPTVAYYKDGKLVRAIVGAGQDVRARLSAVIEGKRISAGDGRVIGATERDKPKWWLPWTFLHWS